MKSDARKKADKKWVDNNKETVKYINYKSYAKTFIKMATKEDLIFLEKLIKENLKDDNNI